MLLTVECTGPERLIDRLSRPLNGCLTKEGWEPPAPVYPVFSSTAFCDWGDAGILLQFGGIVEALSLFAKGDKLPGGELRACPEQCAEQGVIRMLRGQCSDLIVKTLNRVQCDP